MTLLILKTGSRTWPNRGNCCIQLLISSQLLKQALCTQGQAEPLLSLMPLNAGKVIWLGTYSPHSKCTAAAPKYSQV